MRKLFASLLIVGLLVMGAGAAHAEEQTTKLQDVVSELYGVPYKTSGKTKKGFDCSGFTGYVFKELGVELPASSAAQYKVGTAVDKKDLQPGDLVFFNTNGRSISHVGIYIGDGKFVHSESGRGVVNTKLNDPYYWSKRYVGAKRVNVPVLEAKAEEVPATPEKEKAVQAASLPQN
ncbi:MULTISPECIES: C40 family peptidase [Brevibacillus]|uniref:NlpC/P60 family protein n=1 Tax=Brevibacillus invocatus TaxID=173959 RepID=A0A3M8CFH9_9BACL|nr:MULTISPECIES: C40 family peptidase [Brevibacillus]MDH4616457.1 C40 family peptidase [Brevibacillus sp. AY1]RNB74369.1 NlpC/P60 family protein [Brevibacillus invocatus]